MRSSVTNLIAVCGATALTAGSALGQASLSGVPDFSQKAAAVWSNYCAPTNGTNVAYYFAQTYPSLGGPFPPNIGADIGANTIVDDMAIRMSTSLLTGTSAVNLRDGLDSYLEDNWDGLGGGSDWTTTYHDGALIGGNGLEATIQNGIDNGDGVILIIRWDNTLGGPPTGAGYDTPDEYDGGPMPPEFAPMGHAVTAVGYQPSPLALSFFQINDPANNVPLAAHNWPGEGASFSYTVNANDITFNTLMGGKTAIVYGVVTTNIPSPGAMMILGIGLLVMMRRGR